MAKEKKTFEDIINGWATVISGTALTSMILVISLNVAGRYFFKKSFYWAEEVSYLMFNWAVFLGVTIVYRYQGLTAIDIFVNRLPSKGKRAIMSLTYLLIFVINICLIIWGSTFAMNAWVRTSPNLGIPYFYYDIPIPIAGALLAGYSLKFLIKTIKGEEMEEAALEKRS